MIRLQPGACGIDEDGRPISCRCRDMHTQAPGYLTLLYGRARTLASVDLTPANGFSGPTASGCAGVAGSTLETPAPSDIGLFTSTGPSNLTALSARACPGADGEGGMQLAGAAILLSRLQLAPWAS